MAGRHPTESIDLFSICASLQVLLAGALSSKQLEGTLPVHTQHSAWGAREQRSRGGAACLTALAQEGDLRQVVLLGRGCLPALRRSVCLAAWHCLAMHPSLVGKQA